MPGRNFVFLFMSTVAMGRMFDVQNDEESAFTYWVRVRCPDWFEKEAKDSIPPNELAKISAMGKREFLAQSLARALLTALGWPDERS